MALRAGYEGIKRYLASINKKFKNALPINSIGSGLSLSEQGELSATGGSSAWSDITGKPFSSLGKGLYTDSNGVLSAIQFDTMPTAGEDWVGKIVQYTGPSVQGEYTQGVFYICTRAGSEPPYGYSWQEPYISPYSIGTLIDVWLHNLQDGQILKYNATYEKWENVNESGGGGGGEPNYSTTEVDTGVKWIDGKTIYKKTFTGAAVTSSEMSLGTISNLANIIKYEGAYEYTLNGSVDFRPIPEPADEVIVLPATSKSNNNLRLYAAKYERVKNYHFTVYYTKTS